MKRGGLPGVLSPKKALRPASAGGETVTPKKRQAQSRVSISKISRGQTIPSAHTGHRHAAVSDERELIQVELAFYDNCDRICILIHPEARVGSDPGSSELEKMTLKGMISKLTGIPSGSQRLLCRGFDVSDDQMTLRKVGISHGNTVTVYPRKENKQNQDSVVLACTAKRIEKQQKHQQQDSRRAACLRESRKEKKGTMMMPKWGWSIPPDNTKLGRGYNDIGKNSSFRFENNHIWYDDNQGQPYHPDFRMMEIRSHPAYTQPVEFASLGVAPHCE